MSISTDEVNFLVYRYLAESGFSHAAFTFAHESLVARSVIADAEVPPGALLAFLQKGLQYVEVESHLQEDGSERPCDEPFHLVAPHVCRARAAAARDGADGAAAGAPGAAGAGAAGAGGGAGSAVPPGAPFAPADVTPLAGHTADVFALAWSPRGDVLATGSADASARLWRLGDAAAAGGGGAGGGAGGADGGAACTTLRAAPAAGGDGRPRKEKGEVTALDWAPDGSAVVTASLDGRARVWSAADGALVHTLALHTGQIYDVAYSPGGQYVLTGSVDKTAIVWDASTGDLKQQFAFHSAPVLAVGWASDALFATASTDKLVQVCTLTERSPTRTLVGHTDEVNTLAWAPGSGRPGARSLLASGSDDGTVRLWSVGGGAGAGGGAGGGALAVCGGHRRAVYAVRWAPTGEGSASPGKPPMLASASFDGDVRLWEPAGAAPGRARATLSRHAGNVYALAWSPDGELLASVGADRALNVWSARDGSLVKSFLGPAPAFDVAFSASGAALAVAYASGAVVTLDMAML